MHQNIPVSVSQISYSCVKVANSGTGNPNISLKLLTKKVVAYIAYNKSAFQNILRWIELKISKKYLGKQNSKKKKKKLLKGYVQKWFWGLLNYVSCNIFQN